MSFYENVILPRLMNLMMANKYATEERKKTLHPFDASTCAEAPQNLIGHQLLSRSKMQRRLMWDTLWARNAGLQSLRYRIGRPHHGPI